LLIALVAGGRGTELAIELQLSKDATASGQRRAAHARAAIATAEAKRAAFDALVNAETDLPNALQYETIAGFMHAHDHTLLEPFVGEYFGALRRLYETKTNEIAANLIEGLYPVALAGRVPDLQDSAFGWLEANADAHDALKRLVVEGKDGVRRALKAQAADLAYDA
ncbi:MAG: ERAP1-like C-terminal domain-containing protein, partial [Actinomycetes bacterium]